MRIQRTARGRSKLGSGRPLLIGLVAVVGLLLWLASLERQMAGTTPVVPQSTGPARTTPGAAVAPDLAAAGRTKWDEGVETDPPIASRLDQPALDRSSGPTSASPPKSRRIEGLLIDDATGRPLADYRLHVHQQFRRHFQTEVVTDASGHFEVEVPAPIQVVFRHEPSTEDPIDVERSIQREIRPVNATVELDPEGTPFEVTLRAKRPAEVLEVLVLNSRGTPVPGAFVELSEVSARRRYDSLARTNSLGVARVGLVDPANLEGGELLAWTQGPDDANSTRTPWSPEQVSATLPMGTPFAPFQRVLTLQPPAGLEVRVVDEAGVPQPGVPVALVGAAPRTAPRLQALNTTDESGTYSNKHCLPGSVDVSLPNPSLGYSQRWQVDLESGRTTHLDAVLASGALEIAAAGRLHVPIHSSRLPFDGLHDTRIAYRVDGGEQLTTKTRDDGSFSCWAPPGQTVWLSANLDPRGKKFSPHVLEVPFGTQDVEFSYGSTYPVRSFAMVVRSSLTGSEFEHYYVALDHGEGTEEWGYTLAKRDIYELRVRRETRLHIAANDHLVTTLNLSRSLEALGDDTPLIVELDPGFSAKVLILDANTNEPIPGARLVSETAPSATTDSNGSAHLTSDHWPNYHILAPHYDPEDLNPTATFQFNWDPIWLTPTD